MEHSITEVTTDIDLVKAQILVAQGGRLEGEKPAEVGHAVEARLNAEDPDRDFAPSPGRIVHLDLPSGPGIRVDTGVAEGDTIPPDFDSMIAKIIAYGRTREEALARLRRAMSSTTVVIEGGACNKSFVLDLLAQPEVVDGTGLGWADTGWIDRVRAEGRLVAHAHAGIAVVAAAIEAYLERLQIETARLLETAHGGRPVRVAPGRCAGRAQAARRAVPGLDHQHRSRTLPGQRRLRRHLADRRRPDGARSTTYADASSSAAGATTSSPPPTDRPRSSRSTASPTGSAVTRAACSAHLPPRSSSPRPWASATRSRPAPRSSCSSR